MISLVLSSFASTGCAPHVKASAASNEGKDDTARRPALAPTALAASAVEVPGKAATLAPPAPTTSAHEKLVAWLKAGVPAGDDVVDQGDAAPVDVLHTVARGELPATLAHAYLGLSDVYFEEDFAEEIAKSARKEGGFRAGNQIHLPRLVAEAPKSASDERLPMPDDHAVRGLYIRGATTTKRMFTFILDQMAKRDINAIVLDAKDYDGPVTYASKVPLAVESGAARGALHPRPFARHPLRPQRRGFTSSCAWPASTTSS